MADNSNLSIEEILASCRETDGSGSAAAEAAAPAAADPVAAKPSAPAAKTPASSGEMSVADMLAAARSEKSSAASPPAAEAASAAPAKKPGAMSVADMLAAARGEKAAPAKKAAAKTPAKAAAKPKAAAAKKADTQTKPDGPKDTASILSAVRKTDQPGPMSKAEAAAKGQAVVGKPGKPKLDAPPMPARPAYAQPTATRSTDRRGFFAMVSAAFVGSSLAVGFTSLALTHVLWLLGLARFMFPNILTEPPTQFKVGFPDDFAPGQVETKFKAQFGVWIARYEYEGQQQIYALRSVCTHLGCTPNWLEGEQKFKCPCHGSGFYKDGINFEGPAPRPLERYAIKKADDGQLEVDKSRKFNQELGQWADSASFVTV